MNIEQAIEKLKMYKPGVRYGKDLYVANAMAIKALEKQIPKKPIHKYCPHCSRGVMDYAEYCYKCGQKLDWEGLG